MNKNNKSPSGIFEQIKNVDAVKYNSLSIKKMEDLLKEIQEYHEKSRGFLGIKIENVEIVKGPRKKLIINTKRD